MFEYPKEYIERGNDISSEHCLSKEGNEWNGWLSTKLIRLTDVCYKNFQNFLSNLFLLWEFSIGFRSFVKFARTVRSLEFKLRIDRHYIIYRLSNIPDGAKTKFFICSCDIIES